MAIGRVVSRMTGVPAVAVVHGSFLGAGGTSEYLFRGVERSTAWMAKATVTVNDSDAEYYRRFVRPGSVSVAPAGGGGIDDERIRLALSQQSIGSQGDGKGDGLIGYIARLTPDKGLDFLVEAVRRARHEQRRAPAPHRVDRQRQEGLAGATRIVDRGDRLAARSVRGDGRLSSWRRRAGVKASAWAWPRRS